VTETGSGAQQQRRSAALPVLEVCLFALIVGVVAYVAGFRKGARTEQLRQATASQPSMGHQHGMEPPAEGGASLDMDALKAKLAEIDDRPELVAIANQHLDEARSALEAGEIGGAERRFQIAAAAYERALALGPPDPDILTRLGIALRGLHDPEGAVARFREAARADPSHVQSRFNLGLVLLRDLGMEAEAAVAWKEYLQVAPKTDPERTFVQEELAKLQE
jgi:cytochrome c-type biogenesis protein CcmH/NrfG